MTTARTLAMSPLSANRADDPSLRAHLQACAAARGRSFAMRCLGERLHALIGPRFFTTVFAATALTALLVGCA